VLYPAETEALACEVTSKYHFRLKIILRGRTKWNTIFKKPTIIMKLLTRFVLDAMIWYGNRYGPERGFPRCSKFKLRVNRVRFSLGLMFGLGLGLGLGLGKA
jgi:hypothetical protein